MRYSSLGIQPTMPINDNLRRSKYNGFNLMSIKKQNELSSLGATNIDIQTYPSRFKHKANLMTGPANTTYMRSINASHIGTFGKGSGLGRHDF